MKRIMLDANANKSLQVHYDNLTFGIILKFSRHIKATNPKLYIKRVLLQLRATLSRFGNECVTNRAYATSTVVCSLIYLDEKSRLYEACRRHETFRRLIVLYKSAFPLINDVVLIRLPIAAKTGSEFRLRLRRNANELYPKKKKREEKLDTTDARWKDNLQRCFARARNIHFLRN